MPLLEKVTEFLSNLLSTTCNDFIENSITFYKHLDDFNKLKMSGDSICLKTNRFINGNNKLHLS